MHINHPLILLLSCMLYTTPIVAMQKLNITWNASIPAFSIESKGHFAITIGKDETIMFFKQKTNNTILQHYKETTQGNKEALKHLITTSGKLTFQPQSPKATELHFGTFSQSLNDIGLANNQPLEVTYTFPKVGKQEIVYYTVPKKNTFSQQQNNLNPVPFILLACLTLLSLTGLYLLQTHLKNSSNKINKSTTSHNQAYEIIYFD